MWSRWRSKDSGYFGIPSCANSRDSTVEGGLEVRGSLRLGGPGRRRDGAVKQFLGFGGDSEVDSVTVG